MKDHLLDLVQHTHALGTIDLVKISGTDESTRIEAMAADRSVVVQAKFADPVADFIGTFGMPNLAKLNILLGLPEYDEEATIEVTKQNDALAGLHFKNSTGDFQNDYRFMSRKQIEDNLRTVRFTGTAWQVELEPSVAAITRLKHMAQAHSEETVFEVRAAEHDLVFNFGDRANHAGEFVFAHEVTGLLARVWAYPIASVIGILNLPGDAMMSFSNDGALKITVDSGLGVYDYILPAQMK